MNHDHEDGPPHERIDQTDIDTLPPTAGPTTPAVPPMPAASTLPFSDGPPQALLSRIYDALCAPGGELSLIRRDVNGLINTIHKRQREDEANWNFFKSELSATRHDVKRVEEKLDRIDNRVSDLERKMAEHHRRIEALEAYSERPDPA